MLALAEEIRETIIATVAKTGGHLGSSLGRRRADARAPPAAGVARATGSSGTRATRPTRTSCSPAASSASGRSASWAASAASRAARRVRARRLRRRPRRHRALHRGQGLADGARRARHGLERIAVVVGDAALMSGLSLEALNDIGPPPDADADRPQRQRDVDQPVGGRALASTSPRSSCRSAWQQTPERLRPHRRARPVVGPTALELSRRFRKSVVNFAQPGQLFEDLGITYIGVVPGHDLRALEHTFRSALDLDGPVLVHVRTQKGRGYRPAETDQVGFHGAALPPMTDTVPGAAGAQPREPLRRRRDLRRHARIRRRAGNGDARPARPPRAAAEGPELHALLRRRK